MENFIPIGVYDFDGGVLGYWIHNDKAYLVVKHVHEYTARHDYRTPKNCDLPVIIDASEVEKILDSLPESRKVFLFGKEYVAKRVCKRVEIVDTEHGRVSILNGQLFIKEGEKWRRLSSSEAKAPDFGKDFVEIFGLKVKGKVKLENGKKVYTIDHKGIWGTIEAANDGVRASLEFEKEIDGRSIDVEISTKNQKLIKKLLELGPNGARLFIGENASALLAVENHFLRGVHDGERAVFFDEKFDVKKVNGKIVVQKRGVTFVVQKVEGLQKLVDLKLKRGTFVVEGDDEWIYIEGGRAIFVPSVEYIEMAPKWLKRASKVLPVVLVYWSIDGYDRALIDDGKIRFVAFVDVESGKYYDIDNGVYILGNKGQILNILPETYEELVKTVKDFEKFLGKKIMRVFADDLNRTVYFLEDGKTIEVNIYGVRVNRVPIAPLALKEFI